MAYNNRNLLHTVLEAGKSQIKVPEDSVSGESLLPTLPSSHYASPGGKDERALHGLFCKSTQPVCQGSCLMALSPSKDYATKHHHFGG